MYKTNNNNNNLAGVSNIWTLQSNGMAPDPRWPPGTYFTNPNAPPGPTEQAVVKIYACPSRRAPQTLQTWRDPPKQNFPIGFSDYATVRSVPVPETMDTNGAMSPGLPDHPDWGAWAFTFIPSEARRSVIGPQQSKLTFASVKDGTSNTMMVAEKWVPPAEYNGGGEDDNGIFMRGEDDNVRNTGLYQSATDGWRSGLPNPSRDTDQLGDRWGNQYYGSYYLFGSAHPAGINAVFADGSVHSVKFGIDPQTFNALGRMDDGTNLHADPDNIN